MISEHILTSPLLLVEEVVKSIGPAVEWFETYLGVQFIRLGGTYVCIPFIKTTNTYLTFFKSHI